MHLGGFESEHAVHAIHIRERSRQNLAMCLMPPKLWSHSVHVVVIERLQQHVVSPTLGIASLPRRLPRPRVCS